MLKWNIEARRWYCDNEPIHAGASLEIRADGSDEWMLVRIESEDSGRSLFAHIRRGSLDFRARVARFGTDERGVPEQPRCRVSGRWPKGMVA